MVQLDSSCKEVMKKYNLAIDEVTAANTTTGIVDDKLFGRLRYEKIAKQHCIY